MNVISASVPTYQTAACWVVVTENGRFAYAANAASGSISGYQVMPDGELVLLNADGRTGVLGNDTTPIDMALSSTGRYLYALGAKSDTISIFRVEENGSLDPLGSVSVPASAVGLAAR